MSFTGQPSTGLRDLLLQNTVLAEKVASDSAAQECTTYEGVEGLRRLRTSAIGRSQYDVGCGWLYKPSTGIYPEVNRAALGTSDGPLREGTQGAQWFWNLEEAEKKVTTDMCKNIQRCSQLKLLGQFSQICGFCKTTGKVIPIQGQQARYPTDSSLMCAPGDIVFQNSGECPSREGFFATPRNELSLDALEQCQSPLTRDCVVLAARMSGCSDKGTLISALEMSKGNEDYDTVLREKPAFQAYQASANPGLTRAVFQDGSATLSTALDDFGRLMMNSQSQQPKLRDSARELCQGSTEGFTTYNFCSEVLPTTLVTSTILTCLQQDWKNRGGTEQGRGYALLNTFIGKPYQSYVSSINTILENTKSSDKATNSAAILDLYGVDSSVAMPSLPRNDSTRGAETVWINWANATTPIILRCDINFATEGEVYPSFGTAAELQRYSAGTSPIALMTSFELRFDTDTQVEFQCRSDDGFMIGVNQNPFENTANRGNDWGSWRYQAPTTYQSQPYTMSAESKGKPNVIVAKWFDQGGMSCWQFRIRYNRTGNWRSTSTSYNDRKDIYLTQEPLAPWLQYELCTRPNLTAGNTTGFFEKRWNGSIAYTRTGATVPSFDVEANKVIYQTDQASRIGVPGGKGYASFVSDSSWYTRSHFGFTAFRTVTLLIRPTGSLTSGAEARSVFQHINFSNTFGTGLFFLNTGGKYVLRHWIGSQTRDLDVTLGEWHFVVLQYVGDSNSLRTVSCHVDTLKNLQNDRVRKSFLDTLLARQTSTGSTLYGNAVNDRQNAGHLVLGGTNTNFKDSSGRVRFLNKSFEGDVAWIHGFRNYIDTDTLLRAELNQTWKSRWPRGNLDGESNKLSCAFNPEDYANYYTDIRRAFGGDNSRIQKHWSDNGISEGRTPCGSIDPSCKWNEQQYLTLHPDVKKAGMNALNHYKQFGIKEGRAICPPK